MLTINDIQGEVRATGSHWFDPDTMRTFGTRFVGPVFDGKNGIFFATSDKQFDGSRAYTVRQYNREEKHISTVGSIGDYSRRDTAIRAARELSGNGDSGESTYQPISTIEQFTHDLNAHGCKTSIARAQSLIRLAKRHHRFMEEYCNGREMYDAEGEPVKVLKRNRDSILENAKAIGCKGVVFSGDPRGCTVKLQFRDGFTDDWGKEGYCVPTGDR